MNYSLVIIAVLLAVLVVFAVSAILRARRLVIQASTLPQDELARFQRMRQDGSITEEEYKRLKSVVAEQTLDRVRETTDS